MGNRTHFLQTLAAILARFGQTRITLGRLTLGLMALLALGLSNPAARAQNYTAQTLYSFSGGTGDGDSPQAGLVAVNGILYGTTYLGGSANDGTIFSYNPATKIETTLYQFTGTNGDGANPWASLLNVNGILYGSTVYRGTGNAGTLFSFDPTTKTETILHSFNNADGNGPQCRLLDVGGKLYGVTPEGGSRNYGSIFSINPDGSGFQSLYGFTYDGSNGSNPVAELLDVNGIFYGNTFYDGGSDDGVVFSFDPSTSAVTTLARFSGGSSGSHPGFGITEVNGILYGTTTGANGTGNGTIYSIHPDGTGFQTVHSFAGGTSDGANPYASFLLINGILYETTTNGGSANDGTLFSFDPTTNTETVLYSFLGQAHGDGASPLGTLIELNGTLYGTTQTGGTHGNGTIFAVRITVQPPKATNDSYGPKYETAYAVKAPGVLANDSNGGDSGTTAALVSRPTHGTLTFNADGSFTYTPSNGFLGTDTFTYHDTNSAGTSSTATVTLHVQAMAPVAHTDTYVIKHDTTLTVAAPGVLADDSPGDTGTITAALVSNPSHGSLTFHSDGSFIYIPTAGFNGSDSFTYNDTNAVGTSNTAPVNIAVLPDLPIAANDSYTPTFQTAYVVKAPGVLANDNAGGSSSLNAALVDSPTHGSLTFNSDGSFTYAPNSGFVGTDTFTYHAVNAAGTSNTATVTLNVRAALPVAHDDAYTVRYNTAYTVKASGVLANDYPGDNGSFTATLVSTVTHGTLAFHSDGSFTYTPASGFAGTDSFTYYASNPIGNSNTATVILTVPATAPSAIDDSYSVAHNTALTVKAPGVLGNDNTGGSSPITAALVSSPTHGSLTFNSDGSFTYTPTSGFAGTDRFTYQAVNAVGTSNTATVTLTVQAALPIAASDTYAPQYQTAFAVKAPGVLANDNAGGSSTLTATLVSSPAHGTLTFNSDGSFTYTPSVGFAGTDTFTYQAVNSAGKSNIATVSLVIQTSAPIAHGDAYSVQHNTPFTVRAPGVLANDYAGAPGLIALLASQPGHGTLTFNNDGSFTYVPNAGYSGTDSFIYYDDNSVGISNTSIVTLNVQ